MRLFTQRCSGRSRHLQGNRESAGRGCERRGEREKERECNRVPAGSGGRKPEIDMYSMPRRVQSIAGQAGGILSAV